MQVDSGQGAGPRPSGEFFIPDLCAPRSVFILILLAQLMVLVYTLAVSDLPGFAWDVLGTASLLVQWLVLLSAALLCLQRQRFSRLSLQWAVAGSILLVLLVTAISSWLVISFLPHFTGSNHPKWWLLRNLLVALVVTGIALRYFYLQQQLQLRERSELQARLDSLRARIRPHFLFNTLNSIASLIGSRPELAEQAIEDLAELFRASLQESVRVTTVADELHLCALYLGIEQLRLGERLQVNWSVADEVQELPMPSLLLQPLVENAVYHGIAPLPQGGAISVTVSRRRDQLLVEIENPVAPAAGTQGHRMALANIEQRLQGLFGARAALRLQPGQGVFRVQLNYPLQELA